MIRQFLEKVGLAQPAPVAQRVITPSSCEVYFSPRGGCLEAVAREISRAQKGIFVQGYGFTSRPIANSLVEAKNRGVHVELILDKSNLKDNLGVDDYVHSQGLAVWIDSAHPIAHNKVMILDGQTVITGSYNWTMAAEMVNAENLLIVRSAELCSKYAANWQAHRLHSRPYATGIQ